MRVRISEGFLFRRNKISYFYPIVEATYKLAYNTPMERLMEELLAANPNIHISRERIGGLYVIRYLKPTDRIITSLNEPDETGEFSFASRVVADNDWGDFTHHVFTPTADGCNLTVVNPNPEISTPQLLADVKTGLTMWDLFLRDTNPEKAHKYRPQIVDQTQRTDVAGHESKRYEPTGYWIQIKTALDLPLSHLPH